VCEDLTVEVVVDAQQLSWLTAASSAPVAAVASSPTAGAGAVAVSVSAGSGAGVGIKAAGAPTGPSSAHSWQQLPPLAHAAPLLAATAPRPPVPTSAAAAAPLLAGASQLQSQQPSPLHMPVVSTSRAAPQAAPPLAPQSQAVSAAPTSGAGAAPLPDVSLAPGTGSTRQDHNHSAHGHSHGSHEGDHGDSHGHAH
jgi:hypothetical protein